MAIRKMAWSKIEFLFCHLDFNTWSNRSMVLLLGRGIIQTCQCVLFSDKLCTAQISKARAQQPSRLSYTVLSCCSLVLNRPLQSEAPFHVLAVWSRFIKSFLFLRKGIHYSDTSICLQVKTVCWSGKRLSRWTDAKRQCVFVVVLFVCLFWLLFLRSLLGCFSV